MSFQSELEAICSEVPGSRTAVVMSLDGISVANHIEQGDDVDTEALLVELIGPLNQAAQVTRTVDVGPLATLDVSTPELTLVMRLLTDEYLVALILSPDAVAGRGRYALRAHSAALRKELL